MRVSINIQSYKRCRQVQTVEVVEGAKIWVHDFEVAEYEKEYGEKNIGRLGDELRGNLPKVKNFILGKVFEDKGVDGVLLLDDDISKIARWENKKSVRYGKEELADIIGKYAELCNEWGLKLWGINVNQDKQTYKEYTPFSTLSYVSSSFACFLRGNELRYDERLPLKEDYDMTIQQINRYRGILRINGMYYEKKAVSLGGCSGYRNMEKEVEQMGMLQKKWGKKIVKEDSHKERSHRNKKRKVLMDINPIIKVPIRGI